MRGKNERRIMYRTEVYVTDVGLSHLPSRRPMPSRRLSLSRIRTSTNLMMQATVGGAAAVFQRMLKIFASPSSHNPSLLLVDNTLLPPQTPHYFLKMMFQKTLVAALLVASASAFAPQTPAFVTRRAAPTSALFMSAELESKVKDIIVSQLGVDADKVVNSATFVDDLGADSLDTVELIMAIEEEFDCEIPEEEAANISTVQEVIDFVLKL